MNKDNQEENLYEKLVQESINDFDKKHSLTESWQKKIIQNGKNTARNTTIMISLALLLLIIPLMKLGTYMYYAMGGKADHLIDVASKTIYVTKPNLSLEEIELDHKLGFFSMDIFFDVYKKIGDEDYDVGDYTVRFDLSHPRIPDKQLTLERPFDDIPKEDTEVLIHPNALVPFNSDWSMLDGLPKGTVSEAYVSFRRLMTKEELEKMIPENTELRWLAVDTGVEEKHLDSEGSFISAIGYPAQRDYTIWSPFNNDEKSNEDIFIQILEELKKNEPVAEKVAERNLSIAERVDYIKKHGIQLYGAVITGPTESIKKLDDNHDIRAMKVGEVKLWNYR
ncbi:MULTISPECIES: anti-sigma factor C-terminal domain-containing protein [Bacillus]|uniref:anti-sigma factor C-terminal domain-containing protein n=1 Tax=Bacillus TaxID=1386 RepID=UPI00031DC2EE|nr:MULTISPECIES: anti-sigma factor C-terminal domain-containing protein [Bacillus]